MTESVSNNAIWQMTRRQPSAAKKAEQLKSDSAQMLNNVFAIEVSLVCIFYNQFVKVLSDWQKIETVNFILKSRLEH
jgi:hypothetical protein